MNIKSVTIYPTADVSPDASIGSGTRIWHEAQVREGARLGEDCIVGKGAYIDFGVQIGDRVKIQNRASVYHGTTIEDGVFVGPHVVFTNDLRPRAINPDGSLRSEGDWVVGPIVVRHGASVGAAAVVLPGVVIGRFALVGAGAVVTRSVADHTIVVGNPASPAGYACACGEKLDDELACPVCGAKWRRAAGDGRALEPA